MNMTELINLIVNNGIAVVVVGYFMYTNYKFNLTLTSTLSEISSTLETLTKKIEKIEESQK